MSFFHRNSILSLLCVLFLFSACGKDQPAQTPVAIGQSEDSDSLESPIDESEFLLEGEVETLKDVESVEVLASVRTECYIASTGPNMKCESISETAKAEDVEVVGKKIFFKKEGEYLLRIKFKDKREQVSRVKVRANSTTKNENYSVTGLKLHKQKDTHYKRLYHLNLTPLIERVNDPVRAEHLSAGGRAYQVRELFVVSWHIKGGAFTFLEERKGYQYKIEAFKKTVLFEEKKKYTVEVELKTKDDKVFFASMVLDFTKPDDGDLDKIEGRLSTHVSRVDTAGKNGELQAELSVHLKSLDRRFAEGEGSSGHMPLPAADYFYEWVFDQSGIKRADQSPSYGGWIRVEAERAGSYSAKVKVFEREYRAGDVRPYNESNKGTFLFEEGVSFELKDPDYALKLSVFQHSVSEEGIRGHVTADLQNKNEHQFGFHDDQASQASTMSGMTVIDDDPGQEYRNHALKYTFEWLFDDARVKEVIGNGGSGSNSYSDVDHKQWIFPEEKKYLLKVRVFVQQGTDEKFLLHEESGSLDIGE